MRYKVIYGTQQYLCKDIDTANELYMSYFIKENNIKLELWDIQDNRRLCWRSN